jgi:hypothetical protein
MYTLSKVASAKAPLIIDISKQFGCHGSVVFYQYFGIIQKGICPQEYKMLIVTTILNKEKSSTKKML